MHIEEQNDSFEEFEKPEITTKDRRKLLPWWIKFFCWVFMPLGAIAIATIPVGLFGLRTNLSIYGLSATNSISAIGLIIVAIMAFKAFVSYLLFFKKNHAIELGKLDALIGVLICIVTSVSQFNDNSPRFNFRFEIVFLIIYFIKLYMIEYDWNNPKNK